MTERTTRRVAPAACSVWDAVGNTPLLRLASVSKSTGNDIFGKAEFLNPGGSIKDRAAKGMILEAEQRGLLKPGSTIVEGTAGNTGIGLAVLGRERGYGLTVTMPDNLTREKYEYLEALGAEVRRVPVVPFSNPNHYYHQARTLAEQRGCFWADQFENTANGDFHYESTGPELWEQLEGRVDVLVCAVGTGGTISGVSRYLKEKNPNLKVVLADPQGSGLFSYVKTGKLEAKGSSITEGIGIMRVTANLSRAKLDDAVQVTDQQMLEMLLHLAREDGLLVGTSSAVNVRAAYELSRAQQGRGLRIVTFLCDHGSRYASKLANDELLATNGLLRRGLQ